MVEMVVMGGSQHIPVQGGRGLQILVLVSEITVCLLQPSVRGTSVSGLSPHSLRASICVACAARSSSSPAREARCSRRDARAMFNSSCTLA